MAITWTPDGDNAYTANDGTRDWRLELVTDDRAPIPTWVIQRMDRQKGTAIAAPERTREFVLATATIHVENV